MELQQKQICLLTKCEIGYKRGNFQKYIGRHAHYHTNVKFPDQSWLPEKP